MIFPDLANFRNSEAFTAFIIKHLPHLTKALLIKEGSMVNLIHIVIVVDILDVHDLYFDEHLESTHDDTDPLNKILLQDPNIR